MSSPVGERAASVMRLLRDYDRLFLAADHGPAVVWICCCSVRPGLRLDLWWLPWPTFLLRYFVCMHVWCGVESLRRRLGAERALGDGSPAFECDFEAVVRYEQVLLPIHFRVIILGLVVVVFVLGRLVVQFAGAVLSSVSAFTHVQCGDLFSGIEARQSIVVSGMAQGLMRQLGDSLMESILSPANVMDVVLLVRIEDIAVVIVSTAFAVYIVLRLCVLAFWLKRMLFNFGVVPDAIVMTMVRWSVPR